MKHPSEWNEEYLLNLPDYEPNHIEFKGRKALDITLSEVKSDDVKNTLSKAISAFANSGGGLIVYGIKNPQPGKPLMVDDGGIPIFLKGRQTAKEWLEDIIPHLTDLPLSDFHVYPIEKSEVGSQFAEGHSVYIVEIPNSEQAPHQANDNKYYIRAGGKSQPIGHQLVTDIMGRKHHPILNLEIYTQSNLGYIEETNWLERNEDGNTTKRSATLFIELKNNGNIYAQYINCFIYVPVMPSENFHDKDKKIINGITYRILTKNNTQRDLIKVNPSPTPSHNSEYGPSWFNPLLPSLTLTWKLPLSNAINPWKNSLNILWEIYADNAPVKKGEIAFKRLKHLSKDGENLTYKQD